MLRCPGVPLLPGTTFRDLPKSYNPLKQKFMTMNGINMLTDRKYPCYGGGDLSDPDCPPYELPSLYPPRTGPKLPAWLAHDKKVLCFHAYFKETLQEVYLAPFQVRKVNIYFFLEDGTMKVVEPQVTNSGIPQGCLVARQRVPRPPPCHHEFISALDLNVNQTIKIFDRVYHISSCDLFTRCFLNKAGITVPDPVDMPNDPSTEIRKQTFIKPTRGKIHFSNFGQFLEYDRKVLRFNAYWDDKSEFGEVREFEVCYFLSDDTLEIKELLPTNSGRTGPAVFLRRQKLPKEWVGLPLPGQEARLTILNVLGESLSTRRFVADPLGLGSRKIVYYKDNDFQIGAHLNVLGRDFVLTNCDPFTREYYRKKYGIETFTPICHPKRSILTASTTVKPRELPPWNGWGSHEDSEGNCLSIEPKRPHIDMRKFIHLDKFVLRFGAKMFSNIKENCDRVFIISYYLSDDTVQVFELAERNSGFLGGEFFKRAKVMMPNQDLFRQKRPNFYQSHHFFIGSTLNIGDHVFHLVTADEYTLMYMENHPFEFFYADVETITKKIREALRPIYKNFISKYLPKVCQLDNGSSPVFPYDVFRTALIDLLDKNICEHEIITVARHFSAIKKPSAVCDREKVRATTHLEIRRALWDELERLKEHIYHINASGSAYLPECTIRSIIMACRLPFCRDHIDHLLTVLNKNEACEIDVCDFVHFIDVNYCPPQQIAPLNVSFEMCPKIPFQQQGVMVDWNSFLEKIGLEEDLKNETEQT